MSAALQTSSADVATLLKPITARHRFGPETFSCMCFRWDVTKANRMLDAGILGQPEPLYVEHAYAMIETGEVRSRPHEAREIDLTRPCRRIDLGDFRRPAHRRLEPRAARARE